MSYEKHQATRADKYCEAANIIEAVDPPEAIKLYREALSLYAGIGDDSSADACHELIQGIQKEIGWNSPDGDADPLPNNDPASRWEGMET